MSDDAPPKKEARAGAPAWVMTFADLMSLLMCFFVLLLSFSEMDVQKYKQLAGSVRAAFGVQNKVRAHEIPKGTSVVAKEFSPGRPEHTVRNQVLQKTSDTDFKKLADASAKGKSDGAKHLEKVAMKIAKALHSEIKAGDIELEADEQMVVIRILEKGSFPSGAADINKAFMPVVAKIRNILKRVEGKIRVAGHTDDLAINTDRFRSNWDLSSARAASVVQALVNKDGIDPKRFEIASYADTKPRVPNTSDDNRRKNRRVDIIIQQGSNNATEFTLDSELAGQDGKGEIQLNPVR